MRAGAGEVAGHHVAHGVAACLTGREPDGAQVAHHLGHPGQLDVVHLDVLTRRDVAPAPRVRLREVRHHVELLRGDRAGGQLDADHLVRAALTLPVDAVVEPHDPEHVFGDLAAQVIGDGPLEALHVPLLLGVEVSRCGDDGGDAHGQPPLLDSSKYDLESQQ